MLDEKSLRKPGFSDGYKVTLADGQDWTFPKPRIRIGPRVGPDGAVTVKRTAFGPEYDESLDILFGVVEPENPGEYTRVKFEMAVRLLSANYDLTPAQLGELLTYEQGNPVDDERFEQLERVLLGVAPKPSPAT